MKEFWRWMKVVGRWLAEEWRLWGPLAVVPAVMLLASRLPGTLELRVRYCGLIFELLGILTVAWGLSDKRRLFKRPSIFAHFQSWLSRRPRLGVKPQPISLSGTATISLSVSGKLTVWRSTPPGSAAEDRLDALEANLETLRTRQAEITKSLDEEIRNRTEAVNAERQSRESTMGDVRTQVETFAAGSLEIERAGLLWLILGVILATASTEIAGVLTSMKGLEGVTIPDPALR
jgi:hypothetical protein